MSAASWSALVSAVGVIAAIVLQIIAWRRLRFTRQIEIIAELDSRFDNIEFRETRRRAAAYLLNPTVSDRSGREAVQDIINFFETLGFLFEKDVVDAESVWHFFASWLLPYFAASQPVRAEISAGDPNVYSEVEKLYRAVKKIEEGRHPSNDTLHILGPDALRAFLEDEVGLHVQSIAPKSP